MPAVTSAKSEELYGAEGKLFYIGNYQSEPAKTYLLSRTETQGFGPPPYYTYCAGRVRIDTYSRGALPLLLKSESIGYGDTCAMDTSFRGHIWLEKDGKTVLFAKLEPRYTYDFNNGLLPERHTLGNDEPPREQWLEYNLWWATCGHIASGHLVENELIGGTDVFQKFGSELQSVQSTQVVTGQAQSQTRVENLISQISWTPPRTWQFWLVRDSINRVRDGGGGCGVRPDFSTLRSG